MIGTEGAAGVMVLTMRDLFVEVEKNAAEKNYKISISYLEVCARVCVSVKCACAKWCGSVSALAQRRRP